ncbi:hypothetical protein [Endozoicomonas lisbonensis]|uniref:Uncharacterized protein n=1 Tax=Endozoicomonas lisbonensis TaxID=3120522 RepID=A0ABV2SN47_9GAMM
MRRVDNSAAPSGFWLYGSYLGFVADFSNGNGKDKGRKASMDWMIPEKK